MKLCIVALRKLSAISKALDPEARVAVIEEEACKNASASRVADRKPSIVLPASRIAVNEPKPSSVPCAEEVAWMREEAAAMPVNVASREEPAESVAPVPAERLA